jgi:hypothetical protein
LRLKYEAAMNQSCGAVVTRAPTIPDADASAFLAAWRNYSSANNPAIEAAAKKILDAPAVATFLALPDSFAAREQLFLFYFQAYCAGCRSLRYFAAI